MVILAQASPYLACSPVTVDTRLTKLRFVKRRRGQTICAASMCAVARIARASVLQMKGLECHGYAVRVNSLLVAIFEIISIPAQTKPDFRNDFGKQ